MVVSNTEEGSTLDKQKLIQTIAETGEDQLLLARIYDRIAAGQRKNIPATTCFLTGREQVMAEMLLKKTGMEECHFFGGFDTAERRLLCYIPNYYVPEEFFQSEDSPVTAIRAEISPFDKLTHRDFLGSIMGLGVKRETLGDILVTEKHCDIIVQREIQKYLLDHLVSVGRARVNVGPIPLSELEAPVQKVKSISDTVASMRLDGIVASGFSLGRSKASACITGGRTEVNHMLCLKPDKTVEEGDVISVRGLGKLTVKDIRGQTKKGRIAVTLEKLL